MGEREELDLRTDELTDTVQVIAGAFSNLKADHRPQGSEWFRWLIYNDRTAAVVGVVALDTSSTSSLNLLETKVLLRSRAMDILREAA